MVVDRLENLEKYASLNPLFAKAMEYLKTTDLNAQELGKVKLQGDDLVVNFSQTKPKTKEEAKLETHNQFIDIQIPLSGVEVMGYTAREDLPEADYDADKDISFRKLYSCKAGNVCHLFSTGCSRSGSVS